MLAGVAELERELTRERARSGLAAAKARGRKLGRPPGQRLKSDRLAPKVPAFVAQGRSHRLIGREVEPSKNIVADVVRRSRASPSRQQPPRCRFVPLRVTPASALWRHPRPQDGQRDLSRGRAAGRPERVDHRSPAARREEALAVGDLALAARLDRPPETEIGGQAAALERRGISTGRGEDARLARELAALVEQMACP